MESSAAGGSGDEQASRPVSGKKGKKGKKRLRNKGPVKWDEVNIENDRRVYYCYLTHLVF